jgi:predicted metal-dependent hydrolase
MRQDKIKIIRSIKRKKTIQAKMVGDKLWIYLPSDLTSKEEEKWISKMIEKNELRKYRKKLNTNGMLQKRANDLNKQYFNNMLEFDIKFVSNQTSKFGSCTPKNKSIRISDRIISMPRWVQDYIIIHELAHLIHPNHSKEFWKEVYQYKYVERAKGYLIAIGMTSDETVN